MKKINRLISLFLILTLLAIATSLYLLAQTDNKAYQSKVDLISRINEQASQLSLAIFLLVEEGNINYDRITQLKQHLIKLTEQLKADTQSDINLSQSTLKLTNLVEDVKSQHAIYRNSLLFFPKGLQLVHQLLTNEPQPPAQLSRQLNTLEQKVFLFNISSDTINQFDLLQSIKKIENNPAILNLNTLTKHHLDQLLQHVLVIVNYRQQLNELYASILESTIHKQSRTLLDAHNKSFQASLNKAANIRLGFYLAALLLIISIILTLRSLKIASTKLSKNERTLSLAATVFEHSPDGILFSNADNKIIQINHAFTELTGYSIEDVIGKDPGMLSSGNQSNEFYQTMWQKIHTQGKWSGEIYNRRKNGEIYPERITIIAIKNDQNKLTHYISIFNDLSQAKKAEQHIHFLAHYDPLTHLPNRTLFTERLKQAILKSKRSRKSIALLFIDLDRFKEINDSFGHKAGDELLIQVAHDIKSCTRESDNAARFGGDEFIITLEELTHEELIVSTPIVAAKILKALAHKYTLKLTHAYIGASIGIAIYPEDALTADTLLQSADMAMYHAKELGKNNYQYYSSQLNEKAKRRAYIERELRQALNRKQLLLYYQPQYNIISKKIEGFEALLRWKHPDLGLIHPHEFIPIAEESELIITIGLWVLQTAVKQLLVWQQSFNPKLLMAINVSVKQLENNKLSQSVENLLEITQLSPEYLELEVTENLSVDDNSVTLTNLHKLDKLGVQISMDDFGTGYSNMSYLKKFPLGRIKIDRSFITNIPQDNNDSAIACAIIAMAQSFNFKVIAEGIETKQQEEFLLKNGCSTGQGYLFSKPLSSEDATIFLLDKSE